MPIKNDEKPHFDGAFSFQLFNEKTLTQPETRGGTCQDLRGTHIVMLFFSPHPYTAHADA